LDLLSHFRVQYFAALAVFCAVFLAGRRFKAAAVFAGFALINLAVVAPIYFGGRAAPTTANPLRAMLINVNTRTGDPERVSQAIRAADPDILVLEEISSRWVADLAEVGSAFHHSVVRPREDNFGIALFSKYPLAEGEVVYIGEAEVPSIVATVETDRGKLRIIATHPLPPGGAEYSRLRNDQLERLPDHIDSSRPVLLCGDLNATPWNYHFKRLLKRSGLIDSSLGRGFQPTWPSHNRLLLIPIDHVLHSPSVAVINKEIGSSVGSDHYPVIVDFTIESDR
jgi:endonuclease/exonuclease/phosphatase (EEP) superfamily protein YafD